MTSCFVPLDTSSSNALAPRPAADHPSQDDHQPTQFYTLIHTLNTKIENLNVALNHKVDVQGGLLEALNMENMTLNKKLDVQNGVLDALNVDNMVLNKKLDLQNAVLAALDVDLNDKLSALVVQNGTHSRRIIKTCGRLLVETHHHLPSQEFSSNPPRSSPSNHLGSSYSGVYDLCTARTKSQLQEFIQTNQVFNIDMHDGSVDLIYDSESSLVTKDGNQVAR